MVWMNDNNTGTDNLNTEKMSFTKFWCVAIRIECKIRILPIFSDFVRLWGILMISSHSKQTTTTALAQAKLCEIYKYMFDKNYFQFIDIPWQSVFHFIVNGSWTQLIIVESRKYGKVFSKNVGKSSKSCEWNVKLVSIDGKNN